MAETVPFGDYEIMTVEERADPGIEGEGAWTSIAYIYRVGHPLPFEKMREARGGDAFEARRQALLRATERIRRLQRKWPSGAPTLKCIDHLTTPSITGMVVESAPATAKDYTIGDFRILTEESLGTGGTRATWYSTALVYKGATETPVLVYKNLGEGGDAAEAQQNAVLEAIRRVTRKLKRKARRAAAGARTEAQDRT